MRQFGFCDYFTQGMRFMPQAGRNDNAQGFGVRRLIIVKQWGSMVCHHG
jgi:hypothetical protein